MADIWVGVNGADEALRQVNAEMLGGARALADQAGATVVAIVWGASAAGHAKALASWGADRVVIVESEAAPAPEAVARTLARLAAESAPAVVLLADGAESRVAAPLLAEALDAPLFSDVVDIEAGDEVFFTRLPYTAKVIERATAAAPTVVATVRPKALPVPEADASRTVEVVATPADAADLARIVQSVARAASERVDLAEADIVVAGGRGMGSAEGFRLLAELFKGDLARFAQLFFVCARTAANDIADTGKKVAENIGAENRFTGDHAAILGYGLPFQGWRC